MIDALHAYTLGDLSRENRRRFPQRTAVVCDHHRLSYLELDNRVNRLRNALRKLGVAAGDRILWLGQNCHRVLELVLAAAKLGAILVPANWRQTEEELIFIINDCNPAIVFWQDEEIGTKVARARNVVNGSAIWIQHDGAGRQNYESLIDAAEDHDEELPIDPTCSLLAMYTAAFSGHPGAALLTHTSLLLAALMKGHFEGVDADYTYLNAGPLFHIASFMGLITAIQFGGKNVFIRRTNAEGIARIIERERCTASFLVSSTQDEIASLNVDRKYDLSSFRSRSGSAAWNSMITIDTSARGRRDGAYGQTEVGGPVALRAVAPSTGGAGYSVPFAQVRIFDGDGRERPAGEVGEIVVRGPMVMNGYFGRDDLTEQRFRTGWHHTNDLGRREPDGSITFIGPKTKMLKCGVENVYPVEVENVLRRHPAVMDCAIIGVPDTKWIQAVKAIIVCRAGEEIAEPALIEHCRAHLAGYKRPQTFVFVDALPKVHGATDYEALDRKFGGGAYPGRGTRSV